MGQIVTAAVNNLLTNYAQGLAQDLQRALANWLAPRVTVPAGIGRYKQFDDKNAFQVYETERALGGGANRILFKATDPSYDCRPQALEVGIDDAEYQAAGEAFGALLEQSKIKILVSSSALAHEDKVLTVAKTLAAVAGAGVWSDTNVDPIAEIDAQIAALTTTTGMMPNRLAIGLSAWQVLRNHPKIKARLPVTQVQGATTEQFSLMLLNPGIEVRVGILSKDTTKFGATKNATNIVGAEVFIFIASDSPTQYDPSWIKTFITGAGSVEAVRTYRDENARSTIHAVDWSEDIKITGTACAKRISVS